MTRNSTFLRMATMLLLMSTLVTLGCSVEAGTHLLDMGGVSALSFLAGSKLSNAMVAQSHWKLTADEAGSPLEDPLQAHCTIRFWRIVIHDLQGELVLRLDLEVLDRLSSDLEPRILVASDPEGGGLEVDPLRILNGANPPRGLQYPLLRFLIPATFFQVSIYDPSGEKVLTLEPQGLNDVLPRIGSMLASGIYLYQTWARIAGELVLTGMHKLRVAR